MVIFDFIRIYLIRKDLKSSCIEFNNIKQGEGVDTNIAR